MEGGEQGEGVRKDGGGGGGGGWTRVRGQTSQTQSLRHDKSCLQRPTSIHTCPSEEVHKPLLSLLLRLITSVFPSSESQVNSKTF